MRAQIETPQSGGLSIDKISLTNPINYKVESESFTGFPGGNVYAFFTNSTLERATVSFSDSTWSNR